jgi:copper chaperone CopZ
MVVSVMLGCAVLTTLRITGMTCNGCVKHVDAALRGLPGVTTVQVSLTDADAKVSHDPEQSPPASLVDAVTRAGYEATCHAEPS